MINNTLINIELERMQPQGGNKELGIRNKDFNLSRNRKMEYRFLISWNRFPYF